MSNNGFFDNGSNSTPESGVFTSDNYNGRTVSGSGSPRFSGVETGGFMRVTLQSEKDAAIVDKDAAFKAQMAALPNNPVYVDNTYRATSAPNPVYGDLKPRNRMGSYEAEINENSIINMPGLGFEARVKDAMQSGLIGKTLEGKYVLNYDPEQYEPGYNQRVTREYQQATNRPVQQTHQQQQQPTAISDPVEHVGRILHGMGLDAPSILQQLSNKDHAGLMQALDLVKRGDSSKFIALLSRQVK